MYHFKKRDFVVLCQVKYICSYMLIAVLITGFVLSFVLSNRRNAASRAYNSYHGLLCSRIWLAEKNMSCIPTDTITIPTEGRLGNQITQYAAVWSNARLYGLKPVVPNIIIKRLNDVFEGLSIPSINEFLKNKTSCKVEEREMDIQDIIGWREDIDQRLDSLGTVVLMARNTNKIILVEPYSNLGETIELWTSKLHEEFRYKSVLVDGAQRKLSAFRDELLSRGNISRAEQVIFVGVHVRRTDYSTFIPIWYPDRGVVGVDYYRHAVNWMRNTLWEETKPQPLNIVFVVSSDDPQWCKTVLIPALTGVDSDKKKRNVSLNDYMGTYDVFWGGQGDVSTPNHDLVLLSSCNHSIYAYGSFGLWSALMAGGRTAVYDITWKEPSDYIRHKAPSMVFADHIKNWVILS